MKEITVIGHRGAAAHAPENTLPSFETAWRMGADMIELDVHQTIDGTLVCIHDYDVERTTNGNGLVNELTIDEIRHLDAGQGERIPLLEEVLIFAKNRIGVNIELKVPEIEEKVLDMVTKLDMLEHVIFSSFLHSSLSVLHVLNPETHTAVLFNSEIEQVVKYARNLSAQAINPLFFLVTKELVDDAHQAGLKVYPWTVNDADFMREQLLLGVDGIITDLPDLGVDVADKFILDGRFY